MALLTVSTESTLTEARNSVLTASVFHGLAHFCANFGFYACVLRITIGILFYAYKAIGQKFGAGT